ncbi:HVA1 family protein [Candidatus Saccharibacteria bacterium]|nr:HVA1 family protein [Candidatus Saccharibacteria bacterium]
MNKKAQYILKVGDSVAWNWQNGVASGKVMEVMPHKT